MSNVNCAVCGAPTARDDLDVMGVRVHRRFCYRRFRKDPGKYGGKYY